MKKVLITILIAIIVIFGILLLDNYMTKSFKTKPFFAYKKETFNGYIYKSLFANIYYCNDKEIYYKTKNSNFSCPITDPLEMFDLSDESVSCDDIPEKIYDDSDFSYYLSCNKSDKIYLNFKDGRKTDLKTALFNNHVTIDVLKQKGLEIEEKSRFGFQITDGNYGLEEVIINKLYTYNAYVVVSGKLPSLKMAVKEKEIDLKYLVADLDFASTYGEVVKIEEGNNTLYKTLSYSLIKCGTKFIVSGINYPYETNICRIIK